MVIELQRIRQTHSLLLKAAAMGALVAVLSYMVAALAFFAQLHHVVALLLWSTFLLVDLSASGELVTDGSPENLWLPVLAFVLSWLTYSAIAHFWLSRRRGKFGA